VSVGTCWLLWQGTYVVGSLMMHVCTGGGQAQKHEALDAVKQPAQSQPPNQQDIDMQSAEAPAKGQGPAVQQDEDEHDKTVDAPIMQVRYPTCSAIKSPPAICHLS
jgi:hypothetical protein